MPRLATYGPKLAAAVLFAALETYAQQTHSSCRRIVVSIPDRQLAVVEDGRILKIYSVAVGSSRTPNPVGTFRITTRVVNPAWYQPGKVVPPGPNNPLEPR